MKYSLFADLTEESRNLTKELIVAKMICSSRTVKSGYEHYKFLIQLFSR